jgi:putative DNA primase/helicase
MMKPVCDGIPVELKKEPSWVNWKTERVKAEGNGSKPYTKVPMGVLGGKASTTDPETWAAFESAWSNFEEKCCQEGKGALDGIGLVLRGDLAGLDLDHCRDRETGEIEPWAVEVVTLIDSYTEVSPSGTGLRIICRGKIPGPRRRRGAVEMYDESSPRYLTITGVHLEGTPTTVEPRQEALEHVYFNFLEPKQEDKEGFPAAISSAPDLDLDALFDVALAGKNAPKFVGLWSGNYRGHGYPSQSEADLALASILGYYIGPDPEKIDACFRRSGLYRDKWERTDYREGVLGKATTQESFYDWGPDTSLLDEIIRPFDPSLLGGTKPKEDDWCAQLYQAAQGPKAVKLETWAETCAIADAQVEDWLLPGWCEFGCTHILSGLPFSGKSTIMSELLAAIAQGREFAGLPVQQVPFILLDLENRERILAKRLRRALGDDEGRIGELYSRVNPMAIKRPVTPDFVGQCIQAVRQRVNGPKGLVVIDTLRSAFGADELSPQEIYNIIIPFKRLAEATHWAVVILHHNAKHSNKYSGNTAIAGAVDYLWNWTKDSQAMTGTMEWEGRDDVQSALEFRFDLELQRNVFVGTTSEIKRREKEEASEVALGQVLRFVPETIYEAKTMEKLYSLVQAAQPDVNERTIKRRIMDGYEQNLCLRIGEGRRGDPHRYYLSEAGQQVVNKVKGVNLLTEA